MEKYPAYKDSGVEWIGEIPEEWEAPRVQACFYEEKRINLDNRNTRALRFSAGSIVPKDEQWDEDEIASTYAAYRVVSPGTIMINNLNLNFDLKSLRVGLVKEEGIITSAYLALAPTEQVLPRFYDYFFKACDYRKVFHNMGRGLRKTLNYQEFCKYRCASPSFVEQTAIADYLDEKVAEIDGLVADQEKSIELLQEYRKAVISEAVTKGLDPSVPMKDSGIEWIGDIPGAWMTCKQKYQMAFLNGRAYSQEELQDEGKYRVLRVGNFNTNNSWYYSDLELEDHKYCEKDDLLYLWATTFGPRIWHGEKVIFHYHIWKIVHSKAVNRQWLCYWLIASASWLELQSHGSTMVHITKEGMEQDYMPVPPISEQYRIVSHLSTKIGEIDGLIADKQQLIGKLKEYRKSLISEAVTGKFKVPGVA